MGGAVVAWAAVVAWLVGCGMVIIESGGRRVRGMLGRGVMVGNAAVG